VKKSSPVVIELRLSEGVSQSDSQSVEKSVEYEIFKISQQLNAKV